MMQRAPSPSAPPRCRRRGRLPSRIRHRARPERAASGDGRTPQTSSPTSRDVCLVHSSTPSQPHLPLRTSGSHDAGAHSLSKFHPPPSVCSHPHPARCPHSAITARMQASRAAWMSLCIFRELTRLMQLRTSLYMRSALCGGLGGVMDDTPCRESNVRPDTTHLHRNIECSLYRSSRLLLLAHGDCTLLAHDLANVLLGRRPAGIDKNDNHHQVQSRAPGAAELAHVLPTAARTRASHKRYLSRKASVHPISFGASASSASAASARSRLALSHC